MKKLIFAFAAVVFSSAAFAQAEKKADSTPATTEMQLATHCYAMKDGAMIHCMGTKGEPMKHDVTLRNGTLVSAKGEITTEDGSTTMLKNGQCIDLTGTIGDFASMHPDMKMDE